MTWLNVYRAAVFLVCLASFVILMLRFVKNRSTWNTKTRDYWYALCVWSLTGMVIAVEGIRQDSPFGIRILFVSIAALVSLSGLRRKGSWGSDKDK